MASMYFEAHVQIPPFMLIHSHYGGWSRSTCHNAILMLMFISVSTQMVRLATQTCRHASKLPREWSETARKPWELPWDLGFRTRSFSVSGSGLGFKLRVSGPSVSS